MSRPGTTSLLLRVAGPDDAGSQIANHLADFGSAVLQTLREALIVHALGRALQVQSNREQSLNRSVLQFASYPLVLERARLIGDGLKPHQRPAHVRVPSCA